MMMEAKTSAVNISHASHARPSPGIDECTSLIVGTFVWSSHAAHSRQ